MTAAPDAPAPDGAAVERTALAWTRTVVSLAVALLVLFRLVLPRLDVVAVAALLVGLPACLVLLLLARRRGHHTRAAVAGGGAPPDALLPAGTAALVGLLALVELVHLLDGLASWPLLFKDARQTHPPRRRLS